MARAAVVVLAAADLGFAFQSPFLHPARDAAPAFAGRDCYARAADVLGSHGRHLSLSLPDSYAIKDKDGELHGTFSATHYEPLVTRRHALYFAALQSGGAPRYASPWNETSPFMGFLTAVPTPERQRLLDLLGVRAVLLDARPAGRPPAVQALVAGLDLAARCRVPTAQGSAAVEIYANPRALPRVFLVAGLAVAAGPEDALRQLLAPGFDPRRTAIVEADPSLAPVAPAEDAARRLPGSPRTRTSGWSCTRKPRRRPGWCSPTASTPTGPRRAIGSRWRSCRPTRCSARFRCRPGRGRWSSAIGRAHSGREPPSARQACSLALWLLRRWRPTRAAQGATIASSSIS